MSSSAPVRQNGCGTGSSRRRADFECYWDTEDPSNATELTIVPPVEELDDEEEIATHWLSIDADHAIELEGMR